MSFPRRRESSIIKSVKYFSVYIMASKKNGTLYTGITSNLVRRVYEHKNGIFEGFTDRYKVHMLVYFEVHENPEWKDLYKDIVW